LCLLNIGALHLLGFKKEGIRHPLYRDAMLRYFGFLAMWDVVLGVPKLHRFGLKNGKKKKNKYIIYYIYNKNIYYI
jgi:hypothetical protein